MSKVGTPLDRLLLLQAIACDPRCGKAAVAIAGVLLGGCYNGKTGQCNPGAQRLANEARINLRTVARALKELRAAGWFHWPINEGGYQHQSNNYVPQFQRLPSGQPPAPMPGVPPACTPPVPLAQDVATPGVPCRPPLACTPGKQGEENRENKPGGRGTPSPGFASPPLEAVGEPGIELLRELGVAFKIGDEDLTDRWRVVIKGMDLESIRSTTAKAKAALGSGKDVTPNRFVPHRKQTADVQTPDLAKAVHAWFCTFAGEAGKYVKRTSLLNALRLHGVNGVRWLADVIAYDGRAPADVFEVMTNGVRSTYDRKQWDIAPQPRLPRPMTDAEITELIELEAP